MNKKKPISELEVIDEILRAMASNGIKPTGRLIADGELHRFHVDGDPSNTRNGWAVVFLDGIPAAEYGCWKRGIKATWCAKNDGDLSVEEMHAIRERTDKARQEREQRERIRHEAIAAEAVRMWDDAREADTHPYLTRKGVKSYGLRIGEWPTGVEALLIPAHDAFGTVQTMQAIFANKDPKIGRDKDFLKGGKKSGAFYGIGNQPTPGAIIQVVEGYATGATCYEATGHYTAVAFDAGNLPAVCHALRRRYPSSPLVVLCDNDRWTTEPIENPGVYFGRKVAEDIPARVTLVIPEFKNLDTKPTDFNDLAAAEGMDEVRRQITAAIPAEAVPANDNDGKIPLDAQVPPFGFPHCSDKGQPLNTVENLAYVLDQYGIGARYNIIKKSVELTLPGRTYSLDNRANAALAELNSVCARNRMPVSMLQDYVKLIADAHAYNPVCDWIESKPWDGKTRLQALCDTVKVDGDTFMRDMLIKRWLLSAVAAVFMVRGFESHGVLVFTGSQGEGKTKWVKRLLPDTMDDLVLTGAVLDPNNKDNVTNSASHWLVELGELDATFKKADIARLKAFVTQSVDKVRRPYDRIESEYQRRTVFFASVNEDNYLVDDTGNRRWWTVRVTSVDYMHNIDMQQLWAELLTMHRNGERHYLDRDEQALLQGVNRYHEAIDPIEETILRVFDWENPGAGREMTATEVLVACGFEHPNKSQATKASAVLKRVTGKEPRRTNSGRLFMMPKRIGRVTPDDDDDRPF